MSLARVHNFAISLDGFGTGEGQTQEAPFGHAGERLHEWMFATRWWNEMVGKPGGSSGIDDAFSQQFAPGIGVEIMGANKFGQPGWHDDPDWTGWWGDNPPFHTPTFVFTHHPRPSDRDGGRHHVPLHRRVARRSARDRPRSCGRPRRAHRRRPRYDPRVPRRRLVDQMHVVVVPIVLGRGVRLVGRTRGTRKHYAIESASSPSGVTHLTFTRAGV